MEVRTARSLALVAALALAVAAILAVGVVLSGILGERGDLRADGYGIATVSGVSTVVVCDERGISRIVIEGDRSTVVWTATADGSSEPRSAVPISSQVPGYLVDGPPLSPGSEYRLTTLTIEGSNVLVTEPSFIPGQIPEGSIRTGDGKLTLLPDFEASTTGCVL
jgi:hypothetical protein